MVVVNFKCTFWTLHGVHLLCTIMKFPSLTITQICLGSLRDGFTRFWPLGFPWTPPVPLLNPRAKAVSYMALISRNWKIKSSFLILKYKFRPQPIVYSFLRKNKNIKLNTNVSRKIDMVQNSRNRYFMPKPKHMYTL